MTSLEELVRQTLVERAGDVGAVELVVQDRSPRHSRWIPILAVTAAIAVVLVLVAVSGPWRSSSQRAPVGAVPSPPPGMQWVSFHGITLTVPESWRATSTACGAALTDGVQILDGGCDAPSAVVTLRDLDGAATIGDPVTVGGHPAFRSVPENGDGRAELYQLPDVGVAVTVTGRGIDSVIASIEYTPVDRLGCSAAGPGPLVYRASLDLSDATDVRVCEYPSDGLGSWLVGSRQLTAAETQQLIRLLDTAQVVEASPSGTVAIAGFPSSGPHDGIHVFRFERPDGRTETVSLDLSVRPVRVYGGGGIAELPGTAGDGPVDIPNAHPDR